MAKLKFHLSHISSVLSNGVPSDDFQWSDPQIYFILQNIRLKLLKQRIDAGKYISPFNYQTIPCLKLERQKIEDCECFTSDCYASQSICNIPKILASSKGLMVDGVWTINQLKPNRLDHIELDTLRLSQYSKFMQEPKAWFIHNNNTFYVTGYDRLAAVKMTALFEDPLSVLTMSDTCGCNEDGSPICIDPYEAEFPLDGDLSRDMWMMTYEELMKVAMMIPPDLKNDAAQVLVNGKVDQK
jgi:hypothetical protein